MARDYEDLYYLEGMSDDEIRDLIIQELNEYPEIDVDLIDVNVTNGAVQLSGRMGTDQEIQQVERVLTDVIGISQVKNELVLDELTRGERSEAADDAWIEENESGPRAARAPTSDEAGHLMPNTQADQNGTDSPQEAIERGTAYEPPDTPPHEGTWSRENH